MDDQLFNLLSGIGGGGSIAAVFFYLWREGRLDNKELRTAAEGAREKQDAKLEKLQARIDELQDKRLNEALSLRLLVESSNAKDDALLAAFKRDAA